MCGVLLRTRVSFVLFFEGLLSVLIVYILHMLIYLAAFSIFDIHSFIHTKKCGGMSKIENSA